MSNDFEEILEQIGSFGRFQILLMIIVNVSDATASWGMLIMTLAGASPNWWCPGQEKLNDTSTSTSIARTTTAFTSGQYVVYTENATTYLQYCPEDGRLCPNITYSNDFSSIVSEWNLVCGRQWVTGIITTVQMTGVMVGAMIAGQLGDFLGRKKSYFILYLCLLVTNLITAFSVSVEMYTAMRFFVGIPTGGLLVLNFVMPVEYIGQRYRVFGNVMPFFAFGGMVMAGLAYLIRDWRTLAITISALGLPYFLTWWFIPESARWLMTHGRFEETEQILRRIAKINKKPPLATAKLCVLEKIAKEDIKERDNQQNYTILDLLRSLEYLKKTIILFIAWFCCGLMYYGLSFGVKNLQGDRYINLVISSAVDIPSYFAIFVNYKLGRRFTTILFLTIGAIASFAVPILYWTGNYQEELVSAFSLTAKLAMNGGWLTMMLFTTEHYPTVVRNIGLGACHTGARIGGMVAPIVVETHMISPIIPYITFGVVSVIASVCMMLLKETRNQHMEDYLPPPKKHGHLADDEFDGSDKVETTML